VQPNSLTSSGGGFGLSAFTGHVTFLAQCQENLLAKGKKVVVAILEHSEYIFKFSIGTWFDIDNRSHTRSEISNSVPPRYSSPASYPQAWISTW